MCISTRCACPSPIRLSLLTCGAPEFRLVPLARNVAAAATADPVVKGLISEGLMDSQRLRVCIVGAGPAGLALAHILQQAKISFVVLERQQHSSRCGMPSRTHLNTNATAPGGPSRKGEDYVVATILCCSGDFASGGNPSARTVRHCLAPPVSFFKAKILGGSLASSFSASRRGLAASFGRNT
jgi:hypothetical protein